MIVRVSGRFLLVLLVASSAMLVPIALGSSGASADRVPTGDPWRAEGNQASAFSGYAAGTAGDVNGDGYNDVMIGSYGYDHGQGDEGRVFVYHGSPGGLSGTPDWTAESDQVGARLGYSVGTAGDVNGDGFADVIVGAPYYDNGQIDEGRVFVYHGSPGGLSTTPDWTAESDQVGSGFGWSVGSAGDVNGDGYADAIVGAYRYSNGEDSEGRAFVYHGSARGLSRAPSWTAESDWAGAEFGTSVGTAGDVNGDGYDEAIIGAPNLNGAFCGGESFLYHGSATGLSSAPDWVASTCQVFAFFGYSVGTAWDVNRDGYDDVIIGAYGYDNGQSDEGRAFVFHGSASGLNSAPDWTAEPDQISAYFGNSVGAGDVNGDGYADAIVGGVRYEHGQNEEGAAFIYLGGVAGLNNTPSRSFDSDQASAHLGASVGTAGDVNGDGYHDVIVGVPYFDHGQTDEGAAFVWAGRAS